MGSLLLLGMTSWNTQVITELTTPALSLSETRTVDGPEIVVVANCTKIYGCD